MTYRCGACDAPAEFDHDQHCILFDDYQPQEEVKEEEKKINIASGEDVVCG